MGISPVPSLIALSSVRPVEAALEPLPMARVKNSARSGDDAYSPSRGKSARGSEDHEMDEELGDFSEESDAQTSQLVNHGLPKTQMSFFA